MEITAKYITMIVIQVLRFHAIPKNPSERIQKKLFPIIGIIKVFISYTFK